jgi:hypothetical protein
VWGSAAVSNDVAVGRLSAALRSAWGLVTTSTSNKVAAFRTLPAIVISGFDTGGCCSARASRRVLDILEVINFAQDSLKRHGFTGLAEKPRWENFRWTGLGQKT